MESKTTCVNVRKIHLNKRGIKDFEEWSKRKNSVYIGRNMSFYVKGAIGSIWYNPFTSKKYGREKCLELYEQYIRSNKELLSKLHELKGKELGCWCKPLACHGDILIKLIKELC